MAKLYRLESIVYESIRTESSLSKRELWQLARSESAKLEAQLIELFQDSQDDVIDDIRSLTPKKLQEYKTDKIIEAVKTKLSQTIATGRDLAFRLTLANILAGKIQATMKLRIKGDDLLEKIKLNSTDMSRIKRISDEMIEKFEKGVSLTLSSVKSMLQRASVCANAVQGNSELTKQEKMEQVPVANAMAVEQLNPARIRKNYKEVDLTKDDLESLKKNPSKFIAEVSKGNTANVKQIQKNYFKKQNEKKSQALKEKTAKANNPSKPQSSGEKALSQMQSSLDKNGLFAFAGAGGKRWTLSGYCSMVARTSAMRSTNLGEVFADDSCDLYYIVPHAGSCPLCAKYEGKVYSRSGNNPKYPPLASVFKKIDPNGTNDLDNTYLTIHPNCRHKIVKASPKNM